MCYIEDTTYHPQIGWKFEAAIIAPDIKRVSGDPPETKYIWWAIISVATAPAWHPGVNGAPCEVCSLCVSEVPEHSQNRAWSILNLTHYLVVNK